MVRFHDKEKMNTLLNIDNMFGEYEGHVLPIVIMIGLAAAPLLVWLFFLINTPIKFWWVAIFDLFWSGRWALIILGKEKEKLAFYEQQRADEYKSADEIVHVTFVHDDGLIEYDNGRVAYIVTGYPKGYISDARFSTEFEEFMNELDTWNWDLYLHNVSDELLCEDSLPNLVKYKDKQVIEERIEFYSYQDEYSRSNTGLYRFVFLVHSYKYNWKRMRSHLDELVSSEIASCFNEVTIADYDMVNDIMNRDICGYVNIMEMLTKKYDNEQYYGSKVLWYGDDVPDKFVPEKDSSDMEERRMH